MRIILIICSATLIALAACEPADRSSSLSGLPGAPRYEQKAGEAAYDFQLKDLDGNVVKLSSYKGKLVLLNFWATWCAPCIAEMPSLLRLKARMKGKPFEMVGINGDGESALVKKFVEKHSIDFDVLLDPTLVVAPKYGVIGFPETFFIGPDGKFIGFVEPGKSEKTVRIVADREWDSPEYVSLIESLLPQDSDDTNSH